MVIEIKCTQEQKDELKVLLKSVEDNVLYKVIELGSITDEEIDAWGKFTDSQKEIIKREYAKHCKGFFPNPMCALY